MMRGDGLIKEVDTEVEERIDKLEREVDKLKREQETYNSSMNAVNVKIVDLFEGFEKRLVLVEDNQKVYTKSIESMNEKFDDEFSKVIDSTTYMREGYTLLLNNVLEGNRMTEEFNRKTKEREVEFERRAEERDSEFKTKKWSDWVVIVLAVVGTGGFGIEILKFIAENFLK